ncbi:hypothetical protein JEZ13_02240 [bacterium]|nr:hypothetical protein [bacterium]
MKKSLVLILVIVFALVIGSCDKSSSPSSKEPFSLKIKLVNSNNEPLPSYITTIYPLNEGLVSKLTLGRPEVTLNFTVPKADSVKVEIKDYFGNDIRTLLDEDLQAGSHCLVYVPEFMTPDGIYEAIYTYHDDEGLEKSVSCYLYKFSEYNLDLAKYITNELGEINETNKLSFPFLYFNDEFECRDEMGSNVGNLTFTSPTLVKMSNNEGVTKTATFNITNGKNDIELNWDEMTIVDESPSNEIVDINNTESIEDKMSRTKGNDGGFPPMDPRILAYPNPFN